MRPNFSTWKNVFLDTSVICDFVKDAERFNSPTNQKEKERILLVQEVLKTIEDNNKSNGSKVNYYISSITVSELTRITQLDSNQVYPTAISSIKSIFKSSNLTFLDYSKETAEIMLKDVRQMLPAQEYHALVQHLKELSVLQKNAVIRQWISDDMKIIATAKEYLSDIDVVLTCDSKTFKPIADAAGVYCLDMVRSNFAWDLFNEKITSAVF